MGQMTARRGLEPPRPVRADDELSGFDCGEADLDEWLQKKAVRNEAEGASRTDVVCEATSKQVVGYYCLATGAVRRSSAPGGVRRNMPEPIPVMVLGRLAVARSFHGQGLGSGLLRDAVLRTLQAADIAGIRARLVHALSDRARMFYEERGFPQSPVDPDTLMLRLGEAKRIVAS